MIRRKNLLRKPSIHLATEAPIPPTTPSTNLRVSKRKKNSNIVSVELDAKPSKRSAATQSLKSHAEEAAENEPKEAEDEPKQLRRRKSLKAKEPFEIKRMELFHAAPVFHLGEKTFNSKSFPQLYRSWDEYEVTDALATDPDYCLVAVVNSARPLRSSARKSAVTNQDESTASSEKVVGFIISHIVEKKRKEHSAGYLGWVVVSEKYRRQGVATELVKRMEALFRAENIVSIIVDTPAGNLPARKFLSSLGFGDATEHVYMSLNIAEKLSSTPTITIPEKRRGMKRQSLPATPMGAKDIKSMGEIKIRNMRIDDLVAVFEIGEAVYTQDRFPTLFRTWSESEIIEIFGTDQQNCLVAELQPNKKGGKKQIVGFALGTTIEKAQSSWVYGYLVWLGVSLHVQRAGVARKLFDAFRNIMSTENHARILMIDTEAANAPARNFFERLGFGNVEMHIYLTKSITPVNDDTRISMPAKLPKKILAPVRGMKHKK